MPQQGKILRAVEVHSLCQKANAFLTGSSEGCVWSTDFQSFAAREIIHVCEGTRLGYCNDLCIDTDTGRVTALMVPGPCRFLGLFGRDSDYIIPWCCIRRIGEDIILVEGSISSWRVMRKRRGLF